jgi:HK97 family phage major capsid protein
MTKNQKALYEEKRVLVDKMEGIVKEIDSQSGKSTAEQRKAFSEIETQIQELNQSLRFEEERSQKENEKIVRSLNTPSLEDGENFRTSAGVELPVFNRSNKGSVRSWYEKENGENDALKGMTFGRILRAHIFGARNEEEERALSEGTPSAGGYTVPSLISADFVDRLRPISRILQAGANLFTIDDKTNKYNIAKLTGGITIQWLAENAESTPADITFGNVQFGFKTCRAIVKVSNELLQDSLNIERVLTQESVRSFASEFDRVALVGNGTTEPKGIINYTDQEYVSMATNGAAPDSYDEIIALIAELQTNNANVDGLTPAIMHPRTLASYNVLKSATDEQPIRRPAYIENMPFLHTTSVPVTDTYGSSSVASKLFLGDWTQLYYGMRLGITIVPLNQRYAEFNQTAFMIVARIDVQPYHEEAFGYIRGLLGSSIPT